MASDWTYGSIQDMTNGGADNLSSITVVSGLSSGLVSIQVLWESFSTGSANQSLLLQLGDSGGIETTGYSYDVQTTTTTQLGITTGFLATPDTVQDAADILSGIFEMWRKDTSSHLWFCRSACIEHSTAAPRNGFGTKTLTGEITQILATTTGGSAVFDGGNIRARYR